MSLHGCSASYRLPCGWNHKPHEGVHSLKAIAGVWLAGAMPAQAATALHGREMSQAGYTAFALSRRFPAFCRRYMDGRRYASAGSHCKQAGGWQTSSAPSSCSAPFDRPFGLLLNVAVGGLLPGRAPGADTIFPQTMLVRLTETLTEACCPLM